MENETRRTELSGKIKQMGQALINEGTGGKDYTVAQSGTIMLLISKLIVNDEDMFIFSELCAMFAAKRILEEGTDTEKLEKKILAQLLLKKKMVEQKKDTPEAKNNESNEQPKKRRGGRKPKNLGDGEK